MIKKLIHCIWLTLIMLNVAYAQTASILPPAKTTFVDQNGKPLTGGKVQFYVPGTTTPKKTWQDAGETIPNTNPVVLDSAGRAIILGDGTYRQQVYDRNGNLIWDQQTASGGSGGGGSVTPTVGDGDLVGTIKPWSGFAAPPQYVFAYGQELARASFPLLFSTITSQQTVNCTSGSPTLTSVGDTSQLKIGGKVESVCFGATAPTVVSTTTTTVTVSANAIVSTTTAATFFPFGDGDGSTTFNVPDLRGRTLAGRDNMGSIAANRLTSSTSGFGTTAALGAVGGNQSDTLVSANLPPYTPTGSITNGVISFSNFTFSSIVNGGQNAISTSTTGTAGGNLTTALSPSQASSTFTGTPQNGTSTPFSNIQPTQIFNYIIKTLPDTNANSFFGVASIGGMFGVITCGNGLTCAGNNISATSSVVLPPATPTVLGGVFSKTCTTSNWFNSVDTTGTFGCTQPNFTDLIGVPVATNATKGIMQGDGATINCVSGTCSAIGAATTSVAVGTTTVGGSTTSGFCLTNSNGILGNRQCLPERAGVLNGFITESHASNAVTFALKTAAGADPSVTNPVFISFSNGTGGYVVLSVTSALSQTISAGSTLGILSSSTATRLGIVAVNNAGTVALGVGNFPSPPTSDYLTFNTTAEGGTGTADSTETIYTTTTLVGVQVQPVAYAIYNFAFTTPGNWTASPTNLNMWTTDRAAMPYDFTTRPETPPSQFSSAIIRPKQANSLQYLDLGVNGTPSPSSESLMGWYDTCDADLIANPQANTHCARLAVNSGGHTVIGNYDYGPSPTSGDFFFVSNNNPLIKIFASNGSMQPVNDNTSALGFTGNRWTAVYAVNGTIQTSDAREKKNFAPIDDRVLRAIASISINQWRWIDDDKKINFGPTVQDLKVAFEKEGLLIDDYSMITTDAATGHYGLNYAQFNLLRLEADKYYSLSNIPHRLISWLKENFK